MGGIFGDFKLPLLDMLAELPVRRARVNTSGCKGQQLTERCSEAWESCRSMIQRTLKTSRTLLQARTRPSGLKLGKGKLVTAAMPTIGQALLRHEVLPWGKPVLCSAQAALCGRLEPPKWNGDVTDSRALCVLLRSKDDSQNVRMPLLIEKYPETLVGGAGLAGRAHVSAEHEISDLCQLVGVARPQ